MNQISNPVPCNIKLFLNDVQQSLASSPLYLLRVSLTHLLILSDLSIKIAQFRIDDIDKIYSLLIQDGKMTFVLKNSLHIYVSDANPPLLRYLLNLLKPRPQPQPKVGQEMKGRRRVVELSEGAGTKINRIPKFAPKVIKKQKPESAFLSLPNSILIKVLDYEGGLILTKRLLCKKASLIFLSFLRKLRLRDSIPPVLLQMFMSKAQSIEIGKVPLIKELRLSSNIKHLDIRNSTKLNDSCLDLKSSWLQSLVLPYRGAITWYSAKNLPITLRKLFISSDIKTAFQNFNFPDAQMAFNLNFHKNIIMYGSDWQKTNFLLQLKQQTKTRLIKLRLDVLQITDSFHFQIFASFHQLIHLAIYSVLGKEGPLINQIQISKFPPYLRKLKLGQFLGADSLPHMPQLQLLLLRGSLFRTNHFYKLNYVPKILDVRGCANVGPRVVQLPGLTKVRVCWNTNQLLQANREPKECVVENYRMTR